MITTRINVPMVNVSIVPDEGSPVELIRKGRLVLEIEDGGTEATARVYSREDGSEIMQVQGPYRLAGKEIYQVGDRMMRRFRGCACGGTTVLPI